MPRPNHRGTFYTPLPVPEGIDSALVYIPDIVVLALYLYSYIVLLADHTLHYRLLYQECYSCRLLI